MANKVDLFVINQPIVEISSPKQLEKLVRNIIKKEDLYFFGTGSAYELFLKRIDKNVRPELVEKAKEVFHETFGNKHEIFELKSKDNKSVFIPAELLRHRLHFFRKPLARVIEVDASFKALELFSNYIKALEWKFTQASVMDEVLEWSKTLSDQSFNDELKLKVTAYYLEKNHESDFKELHIPYLLDSFSSSYLKRNLKDLEIFDTRFVIKHKAFLQLFTSKRNPVFLKFLAAQLKIIYLRIDQTTDLKELIQLPYCYRKIIQYFIFDVDNFSTQKQLEEFYSNVKLMFPALELIPVFLEDFSSKLKNADTPLKLILCSSNARNTFQSRAALFEVHRKFAEKAQKISPNASIREIFFKEFQQLQEALLLDICFEEMTNESPEPIHKALDHFRKLAPSEDPTFVVLFANALLLAKIIGIETTEDASDFYYKALDKFPNDPFLHRNLAFALFLKGIALKKSGESLAAQTFFKIGSGHCAQAVQALEGDYISTHLRAVLAFSEADHLWKNQNFNSAFEKYQLAEKHYLNLFHSDKRDVQVLQHLAHAQFRLSQYLSATGRTNEALKKFEQTEECYVALNKLRSNTFSTFKDLGDIFFEHAKLLQKAAFEITDPAQAHQKLAFEIKAGDNFEAASLELMKAKKLKPQNIPVLHSLGLTYYYHGLYLEKIFEYHLADKKFQKALDHLTEITSEDQELIPFETLSLVHLKVARNRTHVALIKAHLEKAIQFGLEALKRDRKNTAIMECLAVSYRQLAEYLIGNKENAKAAEALSEAVNYAYQGVDQKKADKYDQDDQELTYTLAIALYLLATQTNEDWEAVFKLSQNAEIALLKALRQSPNTPLLQEYLAHSIFIQATCYIKRNEQRVGFQRLIDAEEEYKKACELAPNNFQIARDLENVIIYLIHFLDSNTDYGDINEKYVGLEKASSKTLQIKPMDLVSSTHLVTALHYLAELDMENKDYNRALRRLNSIIGLAEFFTSGDAENSSTNLHEIQITSKIMIARFTLAKCLFKKGDYRAARERFSIMEYTFAKLFTKFTKRFTDYILITQEDLIESAIYQVECLIKLQIKDEAFNKAVQVEKYIFEYDFKTRGNLEILKRLSKCFFFQAQYLKDAGRHAEAFKKFQIAKIYSEEILLFNAST